MHVQASPHKIRAVAIVRDKNGKPKINSFSEIPAGYLDAVKSMLTQQEIEDIENDNSTRDGCQGGPCQ